MDCREVQKQLAAFHDGELTPASAQAISEHLAGCQRCRALLARMRRADAALTASGDRAAAAFDASRLADAVFERVGRRRRRLMPSRPMPWAVAAAAAGLLVALGVTLWLSRPGSGPGAVAIQPIAATVKLPMAASPTQRERLSADLPPEMAAEGDAVGPASPVPSVQPPRPEPAAAVPGPPIFGPRGTVQIALAARADRLPLRPTDLPLPSGGPVDENELARELLRRVEVVLTQAATMRPALASRWQTLAERIDRDRLVTRCRQLRHALPGGGELPRVLASAEALLIRAQLAGARVHALASLQEDILASDILSRCRRLRA